MIKKRCSLKKSASIIIALFLILGIVTIAACGRTQKNSDKSFDQDESKSEELYNILRKTEKMPYLKSLIILKNGEMIVEEYMNGGGPHRFYDLRSASKSILSAVLGIAIKGGYIESIDQRVIDFFPEYNTKELDPRVYDLRIRHLITMKSGFEIKETGRVYQQLYKSKDWIEHILQLPFKSDPGKKFNYHSFNTHLLSATITKATGMSTLEYATQTLFSPLGIKQVLWEKDPNGIYIGGWGLSLKAQDMAKFGMLYLNNGYFQGTKVVPSEWVMLSTIERTGMIGTYYSGWNKSYGYGYLWWVKRLNNKIDIPFAMGHGGQRIAIMPNVNAVMVTQAEPNPKPPSSSFNRHRAIDSLLFGDFAYFLLNGS
jgi:CubicO group peptidase (beta-lactamase class C family)